MGGGWWGNTSLELEIGNSAEVEEEGLTIILTILEFGRHGGWGGG